MVENTVISFSIIYRYFIYRYSWRSYPNLWKISSILLTQLAFVSQTCFILATPENDYKIFTKEILMSIFFFFFKIMIWKRFSKFLRIFQGSLQNNFILILQYQYKNCNLSFQKFWLKLKKKTRRYRNFKTDKIGVFKNILYWILTNVMKLNFCSFQSFKQNWKYIFFFAFGHLNLISNLCIT